jgi:tRNA A-37 threonylcarbamoyl transferase component Bud32
MEQFFIKSGSSFVYKIIENNTIIIKKKIYRKKEEKFEREVNALNLFQHYNHFPKIIKTNKKEYTIYMTYCGNNITYNNIPISWKSQVIKIIEYIQLTDIVHGDINPGNICVKNDTIFLIDFGNIRIKGESFFQTNNFDTYRTKQHSKLYKICEAISQNKNGWNRIK